MGGRKKGGDRLYKIRVIRRKPRGAFLQLEGRGFTTKGIAGNTQKLKKNLPVWSVTGETNERDSTRRSPLMEQKKGRIRTRGVSRGGGGDLL